MRPYRLLSNGQQQRARMALNIRSNMVVDDFAAVVDKQQAHSSGGQK